MSVPKAPFGCTNATVVPRLPGRGSSSITANPSAFSRSSASAQDVDAVADVVEALAFAFEVRGHRGVVAHRREQLDIGVGDTEERLLDTVALHDLTVLDLHSVGALVVVDRGFEVVDRDRDVVDLGEHHRTVRLNRLAGTA